MLECTHTKSLFAAVATGSLLLACFVASTYHTDNITMTSTGQAQQQPVLFVIVGRNEPLYEAEFLSRGSTGNSDAATRQNYFVLHAALDLVDKAAFTSNNMYLKVVDKVNQQHVSTFLTAGNVKFMLLHSGRSDETIRNFFQDTYELYVKFILNPFYRFDTSIKSDQFDTRVRALARRYF